MAQDRDQGCVWDCEAPGKAQRIVNDAIVTAIKDVIAELEVRDFARAQSHISGLLTLLDGVPRSTAQLFEPRQLAELSEDLNLALQKIAKGESALPIMHGVFLAWCELGQGGLVS